MSSDTTQDRLNSEPAIRLPDLLMLIEIAGDGTATQERQYDIEKCDSVVCILWVGKRVLVCECVSDVKVSLSVLRGM